MFTGEKQIDVTLNGRVLVVGSQPFMVVGCVPNGDGELVDDRLYGPPDTSYRRFEFVSRHEVIRVKCSQKCSWQFTDRYGDRETDPVDPVPVEVPLRMRGGNDMASMVRQELMAADHRRREASGESDSFMPDDDEDPEDLTDYEVTELLIDEALEVSDAANGTEVGNEDVTSVGDSPGKEGTGKPSDDISTGDEPGKDGAGSSGAEKDGGRRGSGADSVK